MEGDGEAHNTSQVLNVEINGLCQLRERDCAFQGDLPGNVMSRDDLQAGAIVLPVGQLTLAPPKLSLYPVHKPYPRKHALDRSLQQIQQLLKSVNCCTACAFRLLREIQCDGSIHVE
jgi:hypothetical protein